MKMLCSIRRLKKRGLSIITFLVWLILSLLVLSYEPYNYPYVSKSPPKRPTANDPYMIDINASKLNTLLKVLHKHETQFESVLNKLGVLSFQDYIENKPAHGFENYPAESRKYLTVRNGSVQVTAEFVTHLKLKSLDHFTKTQTNNVNIARAKIEKQADKPVIITASNADYFSSLQWTVYLVHKHYADFHFIIYDLGLTSEQRRLTVENCKCEVKVFDEDKQYSSVASHLTNLKTYAWKPIVIQETLQLYESVFYIDSSIRLKSDEIKPVMTRLHDLQFIAHMIQLQLVCYTHPQMFTWFELEIDEYADSFTIDANMLMFKRGFVSSLLIKTWLTCALDRECIAPRGSRLHGCCGCHRFDQDALTLAASYFFIHPFDSNCAYSLTDQEGFFYEIRRHEEMKYFTPGPQA